MVYSFLQTLTKYQLGAGLWKPRPALKDLTLSPSADIYQVLQCARRCCQGAGDKDKVGKGPAIEKPPVRRRPACRQSALCSGARDKWVRGQARSNWREKWEDVRQDQSKNGPPVA